MAAALRGGARSSAKPRAKKPAAPGRRTSVKSATYAPAKLGAVSHIDLPPQIAIAVVAGVVVLGLAAVLGTGHRAEKLASAVGSGVDGQLGHMGLRVKALTVRGASASAQDDIARASGVYQDQPLVGVDLQAIRKNVEAVGWVKSARVERLYPDTILIDITQRQTLAVWQHAGRTMVVDNDGHTIPEADPAHFSDLPLVVGDGANQAAATILPIIQAHPAVMQRLEALVRVDDRRWDLRMHDGGLVQLPAVGEDSALIQLDQMNQKSRILELGFERIDLRDPEMVSVRPRTTVAARPATASGV